VVLIARAGPAMFNAMLSPLAPVGRLLLCTIFVMSTIMNKIVNFSGTVTHMQKEGVPPARFALVGAIIFLIVGSISVIIGMKARIGALLLLVFLVLATYYFHDFWTFEGEAAQEQTIQFMKNLALMGAMLFIIGNGAGPWSVDSYLAKRLERAKK
jgi:putative oxidoreductase